MARAGLRGSSGSKARAAGSQTRCPARHGPTPHYERLAAATGQSDLGHSVNQEQLAETRVGAFCSSTTPCMSFRPAGEGAGRGWGEAESSSGEREG